MERRKEREKERKQEENNPRNCSSLIFLSISVQNVNRKENTACLHKPWRTLKMDKNLRPSANEPGCNSILFPAVMETPLSNQFPSTTTNLRLWEVITIPFWWKSPVSEIKLSKVIGKRLKQIRAFNNASLFYVVPFCGQTRE
jgi:hypothetical protein